MPRNVIIQVLLVVDLIDDIAKAFGSLGCVLTFERAYAKPIAEKELLIERGLRLVS